MHLGPCWIALTWLTYGVSTDGSWTQHSRRWHLATPSAPCKPASHPRWEAWKRLPGVVLGVGVTHATDGTHCFMQHHHPIHTHCCTSCCRRHSLSRLRARSAILPSCRCTPATAMDAAASDAFFFTGQRWRLSRASGCGRLASSALRCTFRCADASQHLGGRSGELATPAAHRVAAGSVFMSPKSVKCLHLILVATAHECSEVEWFVIPHHPFSRHSRVSLSMPQSSRVVFFGVLTVGSRLCECPWCFVCRVSDPQ